jgi:hypothetical protein
VATHAMTTAVMIAAVMITNAALKVVAQATE